jgi:hypothetical protein
VILGLSVPPTRRQRITGHIQRRWVESAVYPETGQGRHPARHHRGERRFRFPSGTAVRADVTGRRRCGRLSGVWEWGRGVRQKVATGEGLTALAAGDTKCADTTVDSPEALA